MSRGLRIAVGCMSLLVPAALTGCSDLFASQAGCPGCGASMAKGSYCNHCQMAVTGEKGMVHCGKCNLQMAAGSYCKMCNKFMMTGEASCCGTTMKAGEMCSKCRMYAGTKIQQCPGCNMPCSAACCAKCPNKKA